MSLFNETVRHKMHCMIDRNANIKMLWLQATKTLDCNQNKI